MKSRPLGASGRGMLLSEQGRHELWAQEGQTSQVSIRVGPLCVWVVVNGRKGHHLTFLTSCSVLCRSRSPLDLCVSSTGCCIRHRPVLFSLAFWRTRHLFGYMKITLCGKGKLLQAESYTVKKSIGTLFSRSWAQGC